MEGFDSGGAGRGAFFAFAGGGDYGDVLEKVED